AVGALKEPPPLVVHAYVSVCVGSRSLPTALALTELPTFACVGLTLSESRVGHTVVVPLTATLPLSAPPTLQRSFTETDVVVFAVTLNVAEPAHVTLPSVETALRVIV